MLKEEVDFRAGSEGTGTGPNGEKTSRQNHLGIRGRYSGAWLSWRCARRLSWWGAPHLDSYIANTQEAALPPVTL